MPRDALFTSINPGDAPDSFSGDMPGREFRRRRLLVQILVNPEGGRRAAGWHLACLTPDRCAQDQTGGKHGQGDIRRVRRGHPRARAPDLDRKVAIEVRPAILEDAAPAKECRPLSIDPADVVRFGSSRTESIRDLAADLGTSPQPRAHRSRPLGCDGDDGPQG